MVLNSSSDSGAALRILVSASGSLFTQKGSPFSLSAFPRDTLSSLVLGRLITLDSKGMPHSDLLKEYTPSNNYRVWRLELADGIKFHSGRTVTSKDLAYSLVRYLYSEPASPERESRCIFLGADTVTPGGYIEGAVQGVKVISERAVTITLTEPNPFFIDFLAASYNSLVPQEALDSDHLSWLRFPVGAGPYSVVTNSSSLDSLELIQTKESRLQFPNAPQKVVITTKADGGPFDLVIGNGGQATPQTQGLKAVSLPLVSRVYGIYFNYRNSNAQNLTFRQALSGAIDRAQLQAHLMGSRVTNSLIPTPVTTDSVPKTALTPVVDWPNLKSPIVFVVPKQTGNFPSWTQNLVSQLQSKGLNCELEWATKPPFDPTDTEPVAYLVGFIPDSRDFELLYSMFRSNGAWVSHREDGTWEGLFAQVPLEGSERERRIHQMGKHFNEKAIAIPLLYELLTYWLDSSKVEFSEPSFQGHNLDLRYVRVHK